MNFQVGQEVWVLVESHRRGYTPFCGTLVKTTRRTAIVRVGTYRLAYSRRRLFPSKEAAERSLALAVLAGDVV